jgi:hypothetical protein
MLRQVVALVEGIAHPFAWHLPRRSRQGVPRFPPR